VFSVSAPKVSVVEGVVTSVAPNEIGKADERRNVGLGTVLLTAGAAKELLGNAVPKEKIVRVKPCVCAVL
jgi:hypothetical protein